MKKLLSIVSVVALGACTYGNPVNHEGFFREADITAVDWTKVNATGMACQTNIFYLIPVGDNSLPRAVKDGKITKLAYVDTDTTLYPLVSRECTNVWGVRESTMPKPNATPIPASVEVATEPAPAQDKATKDAKDTKAKTPAANKSDKKKK